MGLKIICVAGMPGAGKSIFASIAKEFSIPVITMGDAVRVEASKRGIPQTPETLGALMLELRREEGPEAVAKRCLDLLPEGSKVVVIEGVRSLEELEYFKKHCNQLHLVAIHASPRTRFERLVARGRPDDPKDWPQFKERDLRELKVGLGSVIALADIMVVNEGSIDELYAASRKILEGLLHG